MVYQHPAWVNDAVFYQVFPDRFRRSDKFSADGQFASWGTAPTAHNFMGGNLQGIVEGLDHIVALGCNALYLCPIFASTANHRYHTNDYFRIDPVLGSEKDFDALVKACRKKGLRVILDGVFNHCSRGLYQFNSLLEVGAESPFRDWFHVDSFPLHAYGPGPANYKCWWDIPALPKFNTANAQVREFLWSVGEFWMQRGIDGWRLDVPNEIDDDAFWQEFRRRVKAVNPEAYIVGEIWGEPSRWLQGDQFDGVMNYPLRRAILEGLFPDAMAKPENLSTGEPAATLHTSAHGHPHAQVQDLRAAKLCAKLSEAFPPGRFGVPMNLIGSHDNIRVATLGKGDLDGQLMAWAILLFMPGAPSIYAGDEIGLEGGKDPDNRRCFPWDRLEVGRQGGVYQTLTKLIALRHEHACLRTGRLACRAEGQGLVISRELGGERLELRVGFTGPVGIHAGQGKELISRRTERIEGVDGLVVQKGGWQIVQVFPT